MPFELGPRDDQRFRTLKEKEREYLLFLLDFATGVLDRRPDQPEALHNAANALTALGYYESGLRCDQRLATLHPDEPLVIYNLACSLALNARTDAALDRLEEAIALGYHDWEHLVKDPDLTALREHPRYRQLILTAQADEAF